MNVKCTVNETVFIVKVNIPQTFVVKLFQGIPGAGSLQSKAGIVNANAFSGDPKSYAVVFNTPFSSSNYSISISGVDDRLWSYSNQSATGFTINSGANTALENIVSWTATAVGES